MPKKKKIESDEAKAIKTMLKTIDLLAGEVRHLRGLIHWQKAEIRAIHIYAIAKIADLGGKDRQAAFDHVKTIVRDVYDEHIAELEDKYPLHASDIDIRDSLTPEEQEWWYSLEKYYPKKDEPPNG